MGSGTSPEELQAGSEPKLGAHRRRQASIAVVSRADRRLVEAYLSVRRELPRVTRNHLPHALHSSPRRLEQGAPAAFEAHARYASFTPSHAKTDNHGRITDTVCISERPAAVEDRAVPGHWEGDLLFGSGNSQIATLVERQSRYVMLVKTAGKDTQTVINALIKSARKLPQELYKSLTWDRGKEMADHKRFTLATDIKVYFCDPQNPWQRGTNENTNGLLRQYFPKGTDISDYTQVQLNAVARKLNQRPRKTLSYQTPAEIFNQSVASTG